VNHLNRAADTEFPRSNYIVREWEAAGREPTKEQKAEYWLQYARDLASNVKSSASLISVAIARGAWAWAKAEKAQTQIAHLERRLIALERRLESERKGFFYRGTWQEGEKYDEGDFVTDHGGLWHCNAPTQDRPGTSDAFQLAVKAGRDRRR